MSFYLKPPKPNIKIKNTPPKFITRKQGEAAFIQAFVEKGEK